MPGLFVVLWSTGFIGAKLGLPYVEPFTFLAVRVAFAAILLYLVALLTRAPWPDRRTSAHIVVAGLLVHGVYLGGVFYAIDLGLAAGVTAIIVALQPLLTAALAGIFLGERIRPRQWLGLVLGLLGVGLVVQGRLDFGGGPAALVCALAALVGITLGTLYQKRYCPNADLRSAGTLQYGGNAVVLLIAAALFEDMSIAWSGEFIFALGWLVLVLSVGAIGLLFALIRRGAAAQVASLFYLAPPFAALFGYCLFDERLGPQALTGLAVVVIGVALVNWRSASR
ncbi:EamA family transporter [Alkalilimnicola sp. S0819]|nr:EamA family transporter [Alkalilimnicola sp. S0819]MPQ17574.1 EamA family transporter [Alkalilimnicola sp. S0819]